ncbi:MAG: hypothetical protein L0Y60_04285 [Beijerinckiaceae bacterium]|nr:hypothetical protein [Beijerinckiaceae bacterium]
MGLAFLTEFIAYRRDLDCLEANIMTVKKFFTGKGRASKAEMIAAAADHGWNCKDDNAADALGVWVLAMNNVAPERGKYFKSAPSNKMGVL